MLRWCSAIKEYDNSPSSAWSAFTNMRLPFRKVCARKTGHVVTNGHCMRSRHSLRGCVLDFMRLQCVLVHARSEEHTSELQSLMRISYAVFCLKKKKNSNNQSQQE